MASAISSFPAHALTADEAYAISAGDNDDRIAALQKLAAKGDPALPHFLEALAADSVKLAGKRVLIVQDDGSAVDAVTGQAAKLPDDAEDVVNNNRMRSALQAAQAAAQLLSPDLAVRREAVAALGKQTLEMTQLPLIDKALSAEKDPELQEVLGRMKASILVAAPDKAQRLEAVRLLGASGRTQVKSLLQERLAPGAETDPEVRGALLASLDKVSARLAWGERLGVMFTGLSLGSILLLVALGLAITYGLMGVINMAHGELMMIGAYATYVVQNLFKTYAPGAVDYYLWLAVPAAFLAAATGKVFASAMRSVALMLPVRPSSNFTPVSMNCSLRPSYIASTSTLYLSGLLLPLATWVNEPSSETAAGVAPSVLTSAMRHVEPNAIS